MDVSELIQQIEGKVPGAILEFGPFGRSEVLAVWIEMKSLTRLGKFLRDEPGMGYDWLEALTVVELEKSLVFSYFLRSASQPELPPVILRGSVVPASSEAEVDVLSVRPLWPMAEAMELEAADLFGVRFIGNSATDQPRCGVVLPADWMGYPLRKGYVFPMEYLDIPHSRPAGQTGPDEYANPFGGLS